MRFVHRAMGWVGEQERAVDGRLEPVDRTYPHSSRGTGRQVGHVSLLHGDRGMDCGGCCLDGRCFRARRFFPRGSLWNKRSARARNKEESNDEQ